MTYFTYIPRTLDLTFFPQDPIAAAIPMGDAMDRLLSDMAKTLDAAETPDAAAAALYPILGEKVTEDILARAEVRDIFSVSQLAAYILRQYALGKEKNLSAAQLGRQTDSGLPACPTES